jgi:flagellar hook-basal body complex protein FliE
MNISNINSVTNLAQAGQESKKVGVTDVASSVGKTFSQILQELDSKESESNTLLQKMAAGEDVNLDQLMIATEQSGVALSVTMAIRDKLVEAYREITRMAV